MFKSQDPIWCACKEDLNIIGMEHAGKRLLFSESAHCGLSITNLVNTCIAKLQEWKKS